MLIDAPIRMNSPRLYVVLRHEGIPDPHFDLLIETSPGALLMTWRTAEWPIEREARLTKLEEHRRMYLEYEGEVSRERGFVRRVEAGTCALEWVTEFEGTVRFAGGLQRPLQ